MPLKTLNCYPSDVEIIKNVAKKNNLKIVDLVAKFANILKSNEAAILGDNPESFFNPEELLTRFSEDLRKKMVKENNRILGLYFTTNKMIKSMNIDMHYLLNWNEEDRYKTHPLFAEYELQLFIIKKFIKTKYKINNDIKLEEEMQSTLSPAHMEDYRLSIKRTKEKNLAKYRF